MSSTVLTESLLAESLLAESLILAVDAADSSQSLIDAVKALAASQLVAGVPKLITALNYNNPGVAVAAVAGLIQMGKPAVEPLLTLLDDYNYGARAWALRALAGIGDPRAFDLLVDTSKNDFAMSVRRAAARGLGSLHWEELPENQRETAQATALETLVQVCADPEWVVRYAAIVGLESLGLSAVSADLVAQILAQLVPLTSQEAEPGIRARILLVQQRLMASPAVTTPTVVIGPETDWRLTLGRLYNRKSQERSDEQSLSEGDPRRFRNLAVSLGTATDWR